jgi:hypothetical protein
MHSPTFYRSFSFLALLHPHLANTALRANPIESFSQIQIQAMARGQKRTHTEADRNVEWVKSTCTEADLNEMVFDRILPDQATTGWR